MTPADLHKALVVACVLPLVFLFGPRATGAQDSRPAVSLDRQVENLSRSVASELEELAALLPALRSRWEQAVQTGVRRDEVLLVLREAERIDQRAEALAHKAAKMADLAARWGVESGVPGAPAAPSERTP